MPAPGRRGDARGIDWELPDPKGKPIEEVRTTRDEIARRVEALVAEFVGAGTERIYASRGRPTSAGSGRLRVATVRASAVRL